MDKLIWKHVGCSLTCCQVRGALATDSESLLNEVNAAIQAPLLTSYNWDALDDDLQDLCWISGDFLIAFSDAELILHRDERRWLMLLDILKCAHEEWNAGRPIEQGGTGSRRFFGAAFQCTADVKDKVLRRLKPVESAIATVVSRSDEGMGQQ